MFEDPVLSIAAFDSSSESEFSSLMIVCKWSISSKEEPCLGRFSAVTCSCELRVPASLEFCGKSTS